MNNEQTPSPQRQPSWAVSLIPFAFLIGAMVLVVRFFGADALSGGSQVALLASSAIAAGIAMAAYKTPWSRIDEAISKNIKAISSAIIILVLIGAISGTWMVSGIVPTLIYYGLNVISPKIFLFACCIICALVSIMTGSSWTTIATIGVALLGIGNALGYSEGWTAGAIISGAYFGDKISPLSDTTVLASSSAGTPLFEHIRYMMLTTVPSFTIAAVVFLVVSILHPSMDASQTQSMAEGLKSAFNITPWLLIVPVLTGVLIARKVPAMITLFLAALMASIAGLVAQGDIIAQIGGGQALDFSTAFRGAMISIYDSTAIQTGNEALNDLVSTGGMNGMLPTIFLIVCAATFGGVMVGTGMIQSITELLTRKLTSRVGVVSGTVVTGIASNMLTGDQYLSILMVSSLYKKLYKDQGFEPRLLSRSAEDSATVTSVLIPWNSCGMTQATVLHVPTLTYLPYCIFNLISPLMSILMAAIGYKIVRTVQEK